MAFTATVALSRSTAEVSQVINVALTVSSSTSTVGTITRIPESIILTSSTTPAGRAVSTPLRFTGTNGLNLTVPGNGSVTLQSEISFFAASKPTTYTISPTVIFSDGTSIAATPVTITITNIVQDPSYAFNS